jgi:hypothetical protein
MPYNGSGTFDPLPPPTFPAVPGSPISSTYFNNLINDILQQGLSQVLVRDGQAAMLGNLNMGNNRLAVVADPIDPQDGATKAYADTKLSLTGGTLSGSLTISNNDQLNFRNSANTANSRFIMQSDDNFVFYNASGIPIFNATASATPSAVYGSGPGNRISFDESANTVSFTLLGVVRYLANSTGFGFGNSTPGVRVDVSSGDTSLGNGVRVRANSVAGFGRIQFTDDPVTVEYAFLSAGNSGTFLGAAGARSLNFLTNGITRMTISSAGVVAVAGLEVGYRDLPVAASLTRGQCWPITSGVTVNTSAAGELYTLYNNTSGNLTITQGSGVILRLAGTSTTGNRTLFPRGIINLWYLSAGEVIASGSIA